ncbi:hypothetical protein [Ktedonobacter racemifer]|uniref:Uncharacterized protein n=1 Tax=Ktedonobacter racemifer DSM 44963 TaxID=485913 RepID=D6TIC7_KTERA|nr:hypothetical protein [Ktedonobacter racemifer]EFH89184.1 hypothetical protein Krac_10726 [Ktedonobacter racemifer DSM 44963]
MLTQQHALFPSRLFPHFHPMSLLTTYTKYFTPSNGNAAQAANMENALDTLTPLLSVETLTVLQLLGFNFKQAIGEPLTLLLQKFITSKIPADPQSNIEYNKLVVTHNIEALKVVQDKDAADRLEQLRSKGIL